MRLEEARIAIIGLGYVGLPLAIEFGKIYPTIGFDINARRIEELENREDITHEVHDHEFSQAEKLTFSNRLDCLRDCNVYVVTVPTPIDENKQPDCRALVDASVTVGEVIRLNDIVIFESTVYPGATEEICVPEIEKVSELRFNHDFFVGYSPERINPGDTQHRLPEIVKVTSGSNEQTAELVDELYASIIKAGTHKASSIRVAEAAKVIENTQRDLNIALVNELSMIFERLDIDTEEILEAAGTKWNFLPFRPGLVGGHCIGVDPYYLTFKAESTGYHPEVILAGRRINDQMGSYITTRVIKLMAQKQINVVEASVLILGLSFKENCPDVRNTKVVDLVNSFKEYGIQPDIYDPRVSADQALSNHGIRLIDYPEEGAYDVVLLAVAHDEFQRLGAKGLREFGTENCILFDVKSVLPQKSVDGRL